MVWIWNRRLRCGATALAGLMLLAPGAFAAEALSDRELQQADEIEELQRQLEVVVDSSVPSGCALYPAGIAETLGLMFQALVSLKKVSDWTPRTGTPDIIAREGR